MSLITEQVVLPGSHQFLDRLALEYHQAIARRLLNSPDEVLGIARQNLKRWMQVHRGTGTVQALQEWQALLDDLPIAEVASVMTEDSDRGQRLRQSTPFAGVLSEAEREGIFEYCEKGIIT